MNEDNDKQLHPVGDAELEARIVAWVLGEASAFEAEELEQRCAREPELRLFAARMRELHGLIGENHREGDDGTSGEWKLPEAKRRKVVDLLGGEAPPEKVAKADWKRRVPLALAACVVACLMAWPLLRKQGQLAAGREIIAYHPVSHENKARQGLPELKNASKPASEVGNDGAMKLRVPESAGPTFGDEMRPRASTTPSAAPTLAKEAKENAPAPDGIDRVRASLYRAESNFDLGRFDDAKQDYEKVLREDPFNQAARRGLERVQTAKSDYYRAAYDHSRAELLAEVDQAWELDAAVREESAPASRMAGQEVEELGELEGKPRDLASGGIAGQEVPVSGQGGGGMVAGDRLGRTGRDFGLAGAGMEDKRRELTDSAGFGFHSAPESVEFSQLGRDFTEAGDGGAGALSYRFAADELDGGNRAGGLGGNEDSPARASNRELQLGLSTGEGASDRWSWGSSMNGTADGLGTDRPAPDAEGEGSLMADFVAPPAEPPGGGLASVDHDSDNLGSDFFDIIGAGNRSGDGAITRDRISALLNQPDSTAGNFDIDPFAAAEPPTSEPRGESERVRQREAEAGKKLAEREDLISLRATDEMVVQGGALQAYDTAMDDFKQSLGELEQLKVKQVSEQMQMRIVEDGEGLGTKAESNSRSADELRDVVEVQEEIVEEKRKALAMALRTQGVAYVPDAEAGDLVGDDAPTSTRAIDEVTRLAAEKVELESQVETLLRYDDEQLMTYAAGLQLPDNLIRTQYLESKRQLESLKQSGLAGDHPEVIQLQEVVEQMERDLAEGTEALRETLQARLDLAETQLERLGRGPGKQEVEAASADLRETLDLMAEVPAEAEPFSTFSLHVGDASFELAAAAVGRGEMPEPARVRPEEFYNAFDYGDPTPLPGEPVACVVEQCAHPVFPQRNLMRIAVRTGSEGRAAQRPLNLTLMFDNSGSMEREDRAAGVDRAVEQLAGLLSERDRVSVVGFARRPTLLAEKIAGSEAQRLNTLVDQLPAEGGTNLEQALGLAEELAMRNFDAAGENRVVLFTDGAANLGDADPESLNRRIERMRQNGIAFDAAGFGADGLNDRLLERLTRNGNGRYYLVDQPADADAGFARKLAGAFRPGAENVKVQLRFNPERVGRYKLIGFDEHRLAKEDFRNDAVDAAEMAAEEAGVALYQFEVLPEGRGEVGEVSVRFRDPARGAMVERRWTIPYDPQAPAFDQAAASLQLAGLAAMAAEKFRGAPMAEAIEFGEMRQVLGQVKARFGASERVGELGRMIDVLR